MDASSTTQGVTLQPVFIPRLHSGQHSGQLGGLNRHVSLQQPGSPNSNSFAGAAASADWAYLLRNAAALRNGSMSGSEAVLLAAAASSQDLGRATSPQVMSSPGSYLITSTAPQGMHVPQLMGNSAAGLYNSNSMMSLDAVGQLSAEVLASATGDPSNSLALLSNGALAPSYSEMSAMYPDGGVQTLYGSGDSATIASAAAAAAAAVAARTTSTHSILQQQAAAAAAAGTANLANSLGQQAFAGLSNSLNLNSLMKLEESLSGTLFGSGAGGPAGASPKPVSASLYIKNLPTDADKLFLYEKFSPYGAILSVKVLNDPQSGQCRGVGFVNFAEHTAAVRSIQALHGTKVGDKLLHVSLQTPRLRAAAMAGM